MHRESASYCILMAQVPTLFWNLRPTLESYLERDTSLELATFGLGSQRSTN